MALDAPLFFRGLLDRNPFAKIVGTIAQDDIFVLSAESRVYKWFACYPFPYHRCEMKELPITMLLPRALWKSMKGLKRRLKRPSFSTT